MLLHSSNITVDPASPAGLASPRSKGSMPSTSQSAAIIAFMLGFLSGTLSNVVGGLLLDMIHASQTQSVRGAATSQVTPGRGSPVIQPATSTIPLSHTFTPISTLVPTNVPTKQLLSANVPGEGRFYFQESGKWLTGIFLDYWNNHGGLAQNGFPISNVLWEESEMDGKVYAMQYFERTVFEYHPENSAPNNVQLSQLGTFRFHEKYPHGLNNQTLDFPTTKVFQNTRHYLGGEFLVYFASHGGVESIGYPISEPIVERSEEDDRGYIMQYCERAILELHLENAPPFRVMPSRLGALRYQQRYGSSRK